MASPYVTHNDHPDDLISIHSSSTHDTDESGSPIKIEHDYDFQHNLNQYRANQNVSTTSLDDSTFPIAESPLPRNDAAFLSVDPAPKNPFSYVTQVYDTTAKGRNQVDVGKRKGHKYRHSSIHATHQIFQPPVQRPPLTLPTSLPVPTRHEAFRSLSRSQNLRLLWSFCHLIVAGAIQFAAGGSLALTALSRLMFYDAAGAVSCVAVDVMTNFDVWSRSTIKHPFGLGRADVLAGFSMAVFIGFMGIDIFSHGIQHALENLGDHEAHSPHSHERPSTITVLLAAAGAATATLTSAVVLGNHMRIGRTLHVPWLARWGSLLSNPSHFLTLSCCVALLVLPTLNNHLYHIADPLFAFTIAGLMIAIGARLGTGLGNILLMAYTDHTDKQAVSRLVAAIEDDTAVSVVEEAKIWQVHYGLGLADLKIRYRGHQNEVGDLRRRIASLIRLTLGSHDKARGPGWEISIEAIPEDR